MGSKIGVKKDKQKKPVDDLERSEAFQVAGSGINKGQESHEEGGKNSFWNISESGVICVRAESLSPQL